MTKKKLAFYDAFKQKPNDTDSVESTDSSSSSTNLAGHVAYTPGDELTLRPRPKNISTSYHNVVGQNVEIRAKGSSIPPGAAQKWQSPNVNREYIAEDESGASNQSAGFRPNVQKKAPPARTNETTNRQPAPPITPVHEEPIVAKPKAKPISHQSETMPYLDPGDLETQSFQTQKPSVPHSAYEEPLSAKKTTLNDLKENEMVVRRESLFVILIIWLISLIAVFFLGRSFQGENTAIEVSQPETDFSQPIDNNEVTGSTRGQTDVPIDVHSVKSNTAKPQETPSKPAEVVDNVVKPYTIRACTVKSMKNAEDVKAVLEKSGFSPVFLKNTRSGVLVSVGEFEDRAKADEYVKRLKFKLVGNQRPFGTAYVVKQ